MRVGSLFLSVILSLPKCYLLLFPKKKPYNKAQVLGIIKNDPHSRVPSFLCFDSNLFHYFLIPETDGEIFFFSLRSMSSSREHG